MRSPCTAESIPEAAGSTAPCRPCDKNPPDPDAAELEALRQIVERAELALAIYTVAGTCVFASAAVARTMGTTPENWRQSSLWEVGAWKAAGVLHDAVLTLADGDSRTRAFVAPGSDRQAVIAVHRLHHGPHDLIALVVAPATRSVHPAARHTEDLFDFAAATADRVNNGLVPAACALDMLSEETSDSRVSRMLILQAQNAIRRVSMDVSEVVQVMTKGVRSSTPFEFIDILEEISDSLSWHARARLFIDLEAVKELPRAYGSTEQIRAALEHVVDIALESSEATSVSIAATCLDIEEPTYVSSGDRLEPGTYVVFSIADEGLGFEDALERAALPVFSTKVLGRGLELSSVAKVARDHGGGIDLESSPFGQTTVRVWLAVSGEDTR